MRLTAIASNWTVLHNRRCRTRVSESSLNAFVWGLSVTLQSDVCLAPIGNRIHIVLIVLLTRHGVVSFLFHVLIAGCDSISNSSGSTGAFFTRTSPPSLLISMSAASSTGLATSAIVRSPFGDSNVSDSVTGRTVDDFRRTWPSVSRRSQIFAAIVPAVHVRKTCLLSMLGLESRTCLAATLKPSSRTLLHRSACPLTPTNFRKDSSWLIDVSAPN